MNFTLNTPVITQTANTINARIADAAALWQWDGLGADGLPDTVHRLVWTAKDMGLAVRLDHSRTREQENASPCTLFRLDSDDGARYTILGDDDEESTHALCISPGDRDDYPYQSKLHTTLLMRITEYLLATDLRIAYILEKSQTEEQDRAALLNTFRMMGASGPAYREPEYRQAA